MNATRGRSSGLTYGRPRSRLPLAHSSRNIVRHGSARLEVADVAATRKKPTPPLRTSAHKPSASSIDHDLPTAAAAGPSPAPAPATPPPAKRRRTMANTPAKTRQEQREECALREEHDATPPQPACDTAARAGDSQPDDLSAPRSSAADIGDDNIQLPLADSSHHPGTSSLTDKKAEAEADVGVEFDIGDEDEDEDEDHIMRPPDAGFGEHSTGHSESESEGESESEYSVPYGRGPSPDLSSDAFPAADAMGDATVDALPSPARLASPGPFDRKQYPLSRGHGIGAPTGTGNHEPASTLPASSPPPRNASLALSKTASDVLHKVADSAASPISGIGSSRADGQRSHTLSSRVEDHHPECDSTPVPASPGLQAADESPTPRPRRLVAPSPAHGADGADGAHRADTVRGDSGAGRSSSSSGSDPAAPHPAPTQALHDTLFLETLSETEYEVSHVLAHAPAPAIPHAFRLQVAWADHPDEPSWLLERSLQAMAPAAVHAYWAGVPGGREGAAAGAFRVFAVLAHETVLPNPPLARGGRKKRGRGRGRRHARLVRCRVQWEGFGDGPRDTTVMAERAVRRIAPDELDAYWAARGGRKAALRAGTGAGG